MNYWFSNSSRLPWHTIYRTLSPLPKAHKHLSNLKSNNEACYFLSCSHPHPPLHHTFTIFQARVDDTLVFDVEGNPLEKDSLYVISPPIWGPLGGSVTLVNPNGENQTCSEADVVQVPFSLGPPATPFTFTPVDLKEDRIKLGYPLAIQSPTVNQCEGSTVWKVSSRIGILASIITTGGILNTADSCLRITKPHGLLFPFSYIFEYCPFLCGAGFKMCRPIGIYRSYAESHLSPNGGSSFEFILKKVASESSTDAWYF